MTSRILIVDDELPNRRLLETILVTEGYEVRKACNGHEALELVAAGGIDLVLLDVLMPGMDGLETCKAIRAELKLSFLPIVMVTALADRESRMRGKAVGADDFLTKPVFDDELLARVRNLLQRHELMRNAERERMRATTEAQRWRLVSSLATSVVTCRDYAELEDAVMTALKNAFPVLGFSFLESAGESLRTTTTPSIRPAGDPATGRRLDWSSDRWIEAFGCHKIITIDGGPGSAPFDAALRATGAKQGAVLPLLMGGSLGGALLLSWSRPLTAGEETLLEQLAPHLANAAANVRSHVKARELGEARDRLTALLVHDFKNPITIIKANLDCLKEEVELDPHERREALGDCDRAIDRLLQLITDLLDAARAEEGSLNLCREPVEAMALLEELRGRFRRTAATYQVTMHVNAQEGIFAYADRQLIVRVLENLLENALRYAGARGRVELSVTEAQDEVVLAVTNTGSPISDLARARLFEKYGSTQDPTRSAHRGLGLYFCRLVAEEHGGSVEARPRSEGGTRFEVRLPKAPGAPRTPCTRADAGSELEHESAAAPTRFCSHAPHSVAPMQ